MGGQPRARWDSNEERWQAKPVASLLLHGFIVATPIVVSVVVGSVWTRSVPVPADGGRLVGWWVLLAVVSTVALVVTDRLVRRLLPLAALLKLTMLFPDRAPSRYAVARRVSTRDLERRVERAHRLGVGNEPARAAETILGLVASLSLHDRRTRGHAERVRVYTDLIADEYQLTTSQKDRLRWASLLHDIGKLSVPTSILNKPGKPTPGEWVRLRKHPEAGAALIAPLRRWLGEWARAIPEHHEQWDGSGYPKGLAGEDISLAARIVAVADAYEVMTSARPYSKPISPAAARQELTRCAGTQFDPAVVRAFLNVSVGRLRWIAGPVSWLMQLPFVPRYQPLIPLNASLPATVSQVTAAGALAVSPAAEIPDRVGHAHHAAVAAAADLRADAADGRPDDAVDSGKARPVDESDKGKARRAAGNDQGEARGDDQGAPDAGRQALEHADDRAAVHGKDDPRGLGRAHAHGRSDDGDPGKAHGQGKPDAGERGKAHGQGKPDAEARGRSGASGEDGAKGRSRPAEVGRDGAGGSESHRGGGGPRSERETGKPSTDRTTPARDEAAPGPAPDRAVGGPPPTKPAPAPPAKPAPAPADPAPGSASPPDRTAPSAPPAADPGAPSKPSAPDNTAPSKPSAPDNTTPGDARGGPPSRDG